MIKLNVWRKNEGSEISTLIELRHLKPRRYMLSWSFNKILKYAEEELYWQDINADDVVCFVFENEKEHWIQNIQRA